MYFTTFNHYDDDALYNLLNANNENCIICWEEHIHNKVKPMKQILVLSEFSKLCKCNGFFHYDCLLKWINQTNSCPICRTTLVKSLDKSQPEQQLQINNNFFKFAKLFIYIFLIHYLYNIIHVIQNEIESIYENNNNACPFYNVSSIS